MPDRLMRPEPDLEPEKDTISSVSSEEILQALERADSYLPIATEFSRLSEESRAVVYTDPRSPGADRFRLLQIRLNGLQASKNLKRLLITSPLPGDGKTTVALNLATALADKGKRPVLLLEADVYRPSLLKKLGLKSWRGLLECRKNGSDPMLAIRRIDPLGFYLLPAGHPGDEGSSVLQSDFVGQLFKNLAASSFDWILIDSPPTTPIADILVLKAHTDATLLVARAGETPREAIEETARHLGRDHIIGIVLNSVEGLNRSYSKYYGYGKSYDQGKPAKPKPVAGLGLHDRSK